MSATLAVVPVGALAQATLPAPVAGVEVVADTPWPGSQLQHDALPASAVTLTGEDIDRSGVPSLTAAIVADIPSAVINDAEGNPFQPDILFRGFTASPAAGTAEGLAVYVDGARFNEPFGDTVNWDLIPAAAIDSATVQSANPLFGLNALGGSVDVRLKTGESFQGRRLTVYDGSYGGRAAILELGDRLGSWTYYLTADLTHDGGFRQTGASDLRRVYADVGRVGDRAEAHLAVTLAHDTLGNPGATPVQALAADVSSIFTAPNTVDNRYVAATLTGTARLSQSVTVRATAYGQVLTQDIPNGITTEVAPCAGDGDLLCNPDGTVLTGAEQTPVPNFLHGGPYSGLSTQLLVTHAYGGAVQVSDGARLLGRSNRLLTGATYDGADSVFAGNQQIGGFDPYTREFLGPGVIIDQPSEGVNPVRVLAVTRAWGVFADDLVSLTRTIDLRLAARFTDARIALEDQLGGPVNGVHDFHRIDPLAGLTWRPGRGVNLYASFAQTHRAPTPQELSCASPATPCSLLNFFVGDPNLRQVVTSTIEGGARGALTFRGLAWSWNAGTFRADTRDDIIYEPAAGNPNLAFYTNAGRTLRQGVEAALRVKGRRLAASLGYSFIDATFQSPLRLDGGSNPAADANGLLHVNPGDRIPGIPLHRAILVVTWTPDARWKLDAEASAQSSAYRFGDPSNLTEPVAGYAKLDLDISCRLARAVTAFMLVKNITDTHYQTYGSFGPVGDVPWPNVPGGVSDPRTASPGAPISLYGGLRVDF